MTTAGSAQVVYVDAAATGAGNGSSWDDAFTDLTVAIDSAATGSSLWVAAGTYVTPDSSSFVIDRELSLYGGFAGTETEASAADPMANQTILSGDVMGNDSIAYDSLKMVDNNRVLLILDTASTGSSLTVILDGFTIRDGAIADDGPNSLGGAMYTTAQVNLNRIMFTANRARRGSVTYMIGGNASGSTFNNIITRGNYANNLGQYVIVFPDDVSFTNCIFDGEGIPAADRMLFVQQAGNFVIDSCTFRGITTPASNGSALYTTGNQNQTITNTTFEDCSANFGGAILMFGDAEVNDSSTVFRNCQFLGNTAARTGGAVYIQDERFEFTDCSFSDNSGNAGTVGMFGSAADKYSFANCTFTDNGQDSPYNVGSAIYMFLVGGTVPDSMMIDSCTFTSNVTTIEPGFVSGGAIYVSGDFGPRPYVGITNSSFEGNSALEGASGAAIYLVDGSIVDIADSDFRSNNSSGGGGAFFALQFTQDMEEIDTLTGDTTTITFFPEDNTPEFLVTRSLFVNNQSGSQGGVADLQTGQMSATNSLFIQNAVEDKEGSGGAIIINGTDNAPIRLQNTFVNNTFYGNTDGGREGTDSLLGAAGNAIALFQPGGTGADTNAVILTIQNNVFFQTKATEEALGIEQTGADGAFEVISLGGNFFNSSSQPNFPTTLVSGKDTTDVNILDTDIFLDPLLNDRDTEFPNLDLIGDGTNPLINAGTTGELVPEVDFFNQPRDSLPDIGAIEYNGLRVDVAEPIANSGLELSFFPNPTVDVINIVNSDAKINRFTVLVSDMQGRFLMGRQFDAAQNALDLTALPKGIYNLSLLINNKTYSQQVVKQ